MNAGTEQVDRALAAFDAASRDLPGLMAFVARWLTDLIPGRAAIAALGPSGLAVVEDQRLVAGAPTAPIDRALLSAVAEGRPAVRASVLVCLPLVDGQTTIGAVQVVPAAPGLGDVAAAERVAQIASAAVSRAVFTERSARVAARSRFVSDTARALAASTRDTQPLMDLLTAGCGAELADLCSLRLVEPDGTAFSGAISAWHADPEVRRAALEVLAGPKSFDGLMGQVARTGKAVVLQTVDPGALAAGADGVRRAFLERMAVASLICVPLTGAGKVVGVLGLYRSPPCQPFTDEDAELIGDIADHAGLAIANSLLVRSLRDELDERARTENRLRKTEAQLRHAQKMEAVGRLAGGLAHDFNNLLSVVLSYSQLLLQELPEGSPYRADLAEIRTAGWRAAELTQQLLAFSRQQVIEPRIVDLNATLEAMARMVQRLVGEDVVVQLRTEPALRAVRVDPGQIEQVVMNLVINARDAMPGGGSLVLETANVELTEAFAGGQLGARIGPHVMLAISDTGSGMDEATLARIFDPFFTTKGPGVGTGLGLSTVHGIIEQNGGTIWVYSEVGVGTTFKIHLPTAASGPGAPAVASASPAVRGGTERVLLVEDDDQVRALARDVLTRHGYTVVAVASVREATAAWDQHPDVDLLLTDVVMPNGSGRALADDLIARRPALRVLFMSGYTGDAIGLHGLVRAGATLVQKPLTPDLLLRKVREVLDRAHSGETT